MKKYFATFFVVLLFSCSIYSQIQDRFEALGPDNLKNYAKPFATTLGAGLNSGGYNSASISNLFSFSISFRAMYIMIPEDQKTFTPQLPSGYTSGPAATIDGDKGGAYAGPAGYITTPGGFNASYAPGGMPQIAVSFMGTQVMLRYVPSIKISDNEDFNMFGIGIAHEVSQYFPLMPVDVAVQFLYNKLSVGDLISCSSVAFNAHASKTFGVVTPYFGLQYESTSLTAKYTIKAQPNSGDPALQQDQNVSVDLNGGDTFRATLGLALDLPVITINADYSISSQPVLSAGLTFGL